MVNAPARAAIDQYLLQDSRSVRGWFRPVDGWLMALISELQSAHGVGGDLMEIGAFEGRSTILLGYLRGEGEDLLVCDPFGQDADSDANAGENERSYPQLQENRFRRNYARFHSLEPTVFRGVSAELGPRLRDDAFRFAHIDGSHLYDAVKIDIELSKRALGPGGVVVFDDAYKQEVPGVAAAIWGAVESAGLIPIASTTKLYAVWDDPVPAWVDELPAAIARHNWLDARPRSVAGRDLLLVGVTRPTDSRGRQLIRQMTPPGFHKLRRRFSAFSRERAKARSAERSSG